MTAPRLARRKGVRRAVRLWPLVWTVAPALLVSCARPGSPAGGPVPEDPLVVTATEPAEGAVVAPFDGPVRIRLQRTVSERPTEGSVNDAVIVSPETGDVRVRIRGEEVEVSMEGGFTSGGVYRVTVLPRFRDRYENRMAGIFDLVFSTGAPIEPTLLAGLVLDRITMEPVDAARVALEPADGGPTLATAADSVGIFSFPHLPSGQYALTVFDDRNFSRDPDGSEARATAPVEVAVGDTLILTDLTLLEPDETAASLERLAAVDSVTVGATFDDYLDPLASLASVTATLVAEDGTAGPEVVEVLHRHEWDARESDADAPAPNAPPPPPVPLPTRELILVLAGPRTEGVPHQVTIEGVVNVAGIPEGGGEAALAPG